MLRNLIYQRKRGSLKYKMKIVILSRNPALYSTNRLYGTAKARGHETRIVDFLKCYMLIEKENPVIYYEDWFLKNILRYCSSKTV